MSRFRHVPRSGVKITPKWTCVIIECYSRMYSRIATAATLPATWAGVGAAKELAKCGVLDPSQGVMQFCCGAAVRVTLPSDSLHYDSFIVFPRLASSVG